MADKEIRPPGIGSLDSRYLQISNNLSDLADAATARTNLGLAAGGAGDIWVEKAGDKMTGNLEIEVSNDDATLFLETFDPDPEQYSRIRLRKSDHLTALSETDSDDWLGIIQFAGCNTTPEFAAGARIYAKQSDDSGAYVPADLYLDSFIATGGNAELRISGKNDNLVFSDTSDNTMTFASGSITDSTGAISFGDDNLATTGTISGTSIISPLLTLQTSDTTDPTLIFKTTNTAHQISVLLDEDSTDDVLEVVGQTEAVDTGLFIKAVEAKSASLRLYSGSNYNSLESNAADDLLLTNNNRDRDLILGVNDGGSNKTITWDSDVDKLKHSAGTFDFDDDNLTTTGTISGVNVTSGADPGHTHTGASVSGFVLDTGDTMTGGLKLDYNVSSTETYLEVETGISVADSAIEVTAFLADLQDNSEAGTVGHTKKGFEVYSIPKHNQTGGDWEDHGIFIDMRSLAEVPHGDYAVNYNFYGAKIIRRDIGVSDMDSGSWDDINAYGIYLQGWKGTGDDSSGLDNLNRWAIYSDGGDVELADGNLITTGTITGTTIAGANANWDAAYNHSQDNSQAHTDYLINNGDDTSSGSLTLQGGGLTLGDADTSGIVTLSDGAGGSSTLTQAKWADLEAVNGLVKCNGSGDYSAVTDSSANWDAAYTHISNNGSDHSYINQDVTTTGVPTFAGALFTDKVKFTQTDGDEYIDSLADGYMDYGATTGHRFNADVFLNGDNRQLCFGADGAADSYITFDGSELDILSAGAINFIAATGLEVNGTPGVTGTFLDQGGNTITVTQGLITGLGV